MRPTPFLLTVLALLGTHFAAYLLGRSAAAVPYQYSPAVPRFRVDPRTGEVEQLKRAENGTYWAPLVSPD